jgi:acyl carrier protein
VTTRERVQEIFADVFDDPGFALRDDMTANDVEGWDSLNHINLIIAIESAFDVQFEGTEIAALATVGDLWPLLEKYGVTDAR